jgi:hypothetical protein
MKSEPQKIIALAAIVSPFIANAFVSHQQRNYHLLAKTSPYFQRAMRHPNRSISLLAVDDDKNSLEETQTDNFDGEGFASYLGPYAAAAALSIAVTAAFFKFVLLDY